MIGVVVGREPVPGLGADLPVGHGSKEAVVDSLELPCAGEDAGPTSGGAKLFGQATLVGETTCLGQRPTRDVGEGHPLHQPRRLLCLLYTSRCV